MLRLFINIFSFIKKHLKILKTWLTFERINKLIKLAGKHNASASANDGFNVKEDEKE